MFLKEIRQTFDVFEHHILKSCQHIKQIKNCFADKDKPTMKNKKFRNKVLQFFEYAYVDVFVPSQPKARKIQAIILPLFFPFV